MGFVGMTLSELNASDEGKVVEFFLTCCGSQRWAKEMAKRRPFRRFDELTEASEEIWYSLSVDDWKEAFAKHPRIGDVKELEKKFRNTAALAAKEQSGVVGASEATLRALVDGNAAYEAKFGYIFIICATGKSADEILGLLHNRMRNDLTTEIRIAAGEQAQITRLRLEKLLV